MVTDLSHLSTIDTWAALLTETERRLIGCAGRGQVLDLRTGDPDYDERLTL
jgi:hypothetical protein